MKPKKAKKPRRASVLKKKESKEKKAKVEKREEQQVKVKLELEPENEEKVEFNLDVEVDPDTPDKEPLTTHLEGQVYILVSVIGLVTVWIQVEGKEMDVEMQGKTKAEGEVDLAGSIQKGKEQVRMEIAIEPKLDSLPPGQRLCRAGPGEEG